MPNQVQSEDIRNTIIRLVPREVFDNRKRRWSKKFPIEILSRKGSSFAIFLFAPTSRAKEDWYRRLRAASEGITADILIAEVKDFFAYMQQYFPAVSAPPYPSPHPPPPRPARRPASSSSHGGHNRRGSSQSHASVQSSVIQFSNRSESKESELESTVVITDQSHPLPPTPSVSHDQCHSISPPEPLEASLESKARHSLERSSSSQSSVFETSIRPTSHPPVGISKRRSPSRYSTPGTEDSFELVSHPVPPPLRPKETDWINALAARLCWDVWHEKRWRAWVHSRIQRKLIRVKTPSFMEQLSLTDVKVGSTMPVINHLHAGPELKLDGVWVYLDVTYQGSFVMTIETKLKLGVKGKEGGEEGETEMASGNPVSLHRAR